MTELIYMGPYKKIRTKDILMAWQEHARQSVL